MNAPVPQTTRSNIRGLAGRLVADRVLTAAQATTAEAGAKATGVSLMRYLIDTLAIDSRALAEPASAEFGLPIFDLAAMNRDMLPNQKIDAALMMKYRAVPLFHRGNRLFVAISDPMNQAALAEFKFAAGINTDAVLVEDQALNRLIDELAEASWRL